jgi:hypothetical protein
VTVRQVAVRTFTLLFIPHSALAASLRITPNKVDFGVQAVNSETQAATVTLSNDTGQSIQLSEIIASGIDFPASNDCKTELAPGARCSIQVRFKPLIQGDRTGIIEIVASDSEKPHFVPLTGKGQ